MNAAKELNHMVWCHIEHTFLGWNTTKIPASYMWNLKVQNKKGH